MIRVCTVACVLLLVACSQAHAISGYILKTPPESAAAREARHRRVAERRSGTVVIIHRGMRSYAPENTLEAFNDALNHGADGCEVDVRRTADGVLVLFHDDMLEGLTNGFGDVSQLTYAELLSLKRRPVDGVSYPEALVPTFAALLQFARGRAMLLDLDVKQPEISEDIAKMLDEADMWDHVVCSTIDFPKMNRVNYKGGPFEEGYYNDLDAVRAKLGQYGNAVIVEDPRVVAHALGRVSFHYVSMPDGLMCDTKPTVAPAADEKLVPKLYLADLARQVNAYSCIELLALLDGRRMERIQPDGSARYERRRTERILARAWAAQRLGELGCASDEVIRALEFQVANPSIHRDWRYHGLDGSMAVLALSELGSVKSVPVLIDRLARDAPELARIAKPDGTARRPSWLGGMFGHYAFRALGDLRCPEGREFLVKGMAIGGEETAKLGSGWYGAVARTLLRHKLPAAELEQLLTHKNRTVQAAAVQYCLDHVTPATDAALKSVAPWALELPRGPR